MRPRRPGSCGTLFPRYYAWGATCGAIALPAFLGAPLSYPEYRGAAVGVQAFLILAAILVMLYCGNSLTPAINAARDAGPEQSGRFDRLHRRSVRLNAAVMLVLIGLIVAFAFRPPPVTSGIIEPTPQERADAPIRQSRPEKRRPHHPQQRAARRRPRLVSARQMLPRNQGPGGACGGYRRLVLCSGRMAVEVRGLLRRIRPRRTRPLCGELAGGFLR